MGTKIILAGAVGLGLGYFIFRKKKVECPKCGGRLFPNPLLYSSAIVVPSVPPPPPPPPPPPLPPTPPTIPSTPPPVVPPTTAMNGRYHSFSGLQF